MTILVIGKTHHKQECLEKFGLEHIYILAANHVDALMGLVGADVVFDFIVGDNLTAFKIYEGSVKASIFLNTTFITITELLYQSGITSSNSFFGFCGLPGFVNRSLLELSVRLKSDEEALKQICAHLKAEFIQVDDRVGLVTPRVICMIINEAYFTVQEGTATRDDIDLAMKLGTNYPYGPFEWCKQIGVQNVYNLLLAVYEDTKDDRYKICPLMKKEILTTIIQP